MGYENLEELIGVIAKLRSPQGCPWDREQTHSSLRRNMLEEAYEAVANRKIREGVWESEQIRGFKSFNYIKVKTMKI